MEFGDYIHGIYRENKSKYPEIISIYNSIDEIFFLLFGTKGNHDIQHDILLRLLSSIRRSYLLVVFLFQTGQKSAGIQVMRTMIESGELLCACLIDGQNFLKIIGEDLVKDGNDLCRIRRIILDWTSKSQNKSIQETLTLHKEVKNKLNGTLAHANPLHNISIGSGDTSFNFEFKKDLYIDGVHPFSFPHSFAFVSNGINSLLILIYQISLELKYENLKLTDINIFHKLSNDLGKFTERYPSSF